MVKALFNVVINVVATLLQAVLLPINVAITSVFPDISAYLYEVSDSFNSVMDGLAFGIGFIPPLILPVLIFIVTCEIAKKTIYISTHTLIKIWNVIQKIKFW